MLGHGTAKSCPCPRCPPGPWLRAGAVRCLLGRGQTSMPLQSGSASRRRMPSRQQTPRRAPSHLCSASGTPAGFSPRHEPRPWGDAEPSPAALCRSRPRSLPDSAAGYTNPAYFIFEGVPNTWVPAPGAGEAHNKQAESPAGGQRHRSPLGARVPSPSEEERWGSRPRCVSGGPSRGRPLSPPSVGRQKRPKSAVLARDTPGPGDCSLTALHMATCLSQLDRASPEHRGDIQNTLLRQTHSVLEPPPRPCREMPRCTQDARQHGRPGEVPLWSPRGSGAQPRGLGSSGRGEDLLLAIKPAADVGSHPRGSALCLMEPPRCRQGYGRGWRSCNVPHSCRVRT